LIKRESKDSGWVPGVADSWSWDFKSSGLVRVKGEGGPGVEKVFWRRLSGLISRFLVSRRKNSKEKSLLLPYEFFEQEVYDLLGSVSIGNDLFQADRSEPSNCLKKGSALCLAQSIGRLLQIEKIRKIFCKNIFLIFTSAISRGPESVDRNFPKKFL
jgi:hypothetical protein